MKRTFIDIASDIALSKQTLWLTDEEIDIQLNELYDELAEKENAVSKFYDSIEEKLVTAKKYKEKMDSAIKSLQYTQKRLKSLVIDAHEVSGVLPKHDEFNPLKIQSSSSVEVIDESKVPGEYWVEVTVTRLDKKKILANLRNGESIPGVTLKHNPYLKGLK